MTQAQSRTFLVRLGRQIRAARLAFGLGQDELTRRAGLSRGAMSRIENGLVDPQATTLKKIADALAITPGELFEVAVEP